MIIDNCIYVISAIIHKFGDLDSVLDYILVYSNILHYNGVNLLLFNVVKHTYL